MTSPEPDRPPQPESRRLDRLDRLILNAAQSGFPVAARPYAVLAESLNQAHGLELTAEEVFSRVRALRRDGFIRRLGAVFNAQPLGYRSSLCAARVPAEKMDLFRELVNQAPQVTHHYLRSGELNAWFTFTCRRRKDLDEFLKNLKETVGLDELYVLDGENTFKIKVDFRFRDE